MRVNAGSVPQENQFPCLIWTRWTWQEDTAVILAPSHKLRADGGCWLQTWGSSFKRSPLQETSPFFLQIRRFIHPCLRWRSGTGEVCYKAQSHTRHAPKADVQWEHLPSTQLDKQLTKVGFSYHLDNLNQLNNNITIQPLFFPPLVHLKQNNYPDNRPNIPLHPHLRMGLLLAQISQLQVTQSLRIW